MMTASLLTKQLEDMIKESGLGHLDWDMTIESTDDLNESIKEKITENDTEWTVDECFVEYSTVYKGSEFTMISYEHVLTHGSDTRMTCMIYLPPAGVRIFDVAYLAPYSVKADAVLTNRVHILWQTLLNQYKEKKGTVTLRVIDPLNNN